MARIELISVRGKKGKRILRSAINKSLKYSILDGGFYSVMSGLGEQFVNPFVVALNATARQIGFLASIPQLLASVFQLFSADLADKFRKRRLLVIWFALLQALTWALMLSIAIFFKNILLLIIVFTLYAIFGAFSVPPWSSWMGDLIEEDRRGRYFGKRNMVAMAVHLTSFIIAGIILNFFARTNVFTGFAILFAVAFFSRLISTYFISLMYEPEYKVKKEAYFSLWSFVKKMAFNNFGRFVIFLSLISFAVKFSGPFFTVYMLRDLRFSYLTYSIIIGLNSLAQILSMRYWGRFSDRFGNRTIFGITGFLIPICPILWLFSHNVIYLILVQIYSGFVWAGFNISTGNYFFDAVTPQKRARCVAYYNFLNGASIFLGASLGGIIAMSLQPWLFFVSKYQDLFLLSGLMRFLIALAFIPMLKEVRLSRVPVQKHLFLKLTAIEPMRELAFEMRHRMQQIDVVRKKVEDGFFFEVEKLIKEWRK